MESWSVFHPLDPPAGSPVSLRDSCLCTLSDLLARSFLHQAEDYGAQSDLPFLPDHLKHRMLQLGARGYTSCTLNDGSLVRLFLEIPDDDDDDDSGAVVAGEENQESAAAAAAVRVVDAEAPQGTDTHPTEPGHQAASVDAEPSDSWEEEAESAAGGAAGVPLWQNEATDIHTCTLLDLSFVNVSLPTLRRLVLPPSATRNVQLRYLSLAGLEGALPTKTGGRAGPSRQADRQLFKLLASLPNLEHLNLAGVRFPGPAGDAVQIHGSSAASRSDGTTRASFKALWQGCRKLKVLDLSYAQGLGDLQDLTGSVTLLHSANGTSQHLASAASPTSSATLLPQLEHLLLRGVIKDEATQESTLFQKSNTSRTKHDGALPGDDPRGTPAPAYIAPWHSAHWTQWAQIGGSPTVNGHATGDADTEAFAPRITPVAGGGTASSRHAPPSLASAGASLNGRAASAAAIQPLAQSAMMAHAPIGGIHLQTTRSGGGGGGAGPMTASSSSYPTRCPETGGRVPEVDWTMARVVDAFRGRGRLGTIRVSAAMPKAAVAGSPANLTSAHPPPRTASTGTAKHARPAEWWCDVWF